MSEEIKKLSGVKYDVSAYTLEQATALQEKLKSQKVELTSMLDSELMSTYADDMPDTYMDAKLKLEELNYHLLQIDLLIKEIEGAVPALPETAENAAPLFTDGWNGPVAKLENSDSDKLLCGDVIYAGSFQIEDAANNTAQDIVYKLSEDVVKAEWISKGDDLVLVLTKQDNSKIAYVLKDPSAIHRIVTTAEGLSHGVTIDNSHATRVTKDGTKAGFISIGTSHDGDKLIGSSGNDLLIGGEGADELYGLGGSDWLWGDLHMDKVSNIGGDDKVYGGDGADHIFGGGGINTQDKYETMKTEAEIEGFHEINTHTGAELPPLNTVFEGEGWNAKVVNDEIVLTPPEEGISDLDLFLTDDIIAASFATEKGSKDLVGTMVGFDENGTPKEYKVRILGHGNSGNYYQVNIHGNSLDNVIDASQAIAKGASINIFGGNGEDAILSPATNTELAGYDLEGFLSNAEAWDKDSIEDMINNTIDAGDGIKINPFYTVLDTEGNAHNEYFDVHCSEDGTNQIVFTLKEGVSIDKIKDIAITPDGTYEKIYYTKDGNDLIAIVANPDAAKGSLADHLVIRIEGWFSWEDRPTLNTVVQDTTKPIWFAMNTVNGGELMDTLIGYDGVTKFDDNSAKTYSSVFNGTMEDIPVDDLNAEPVADPAETPLEAVADSPDPTDGDEPTE